ncbi:MAG: RNA 2',3'-cyclic phosphodiesterase [Clostridia bacterium]|nr:RNA 2',3'-cyclic phosphodiesterase [Clostridia bacterium]
MRLFYAITFSDEFKLKLAALCEDLKKNSEHGHFTAFENLHLTLVFLGECNPNQFVQAKTVLDLLPAEPMILSIDRIGCFKRNGTWWAGITENETLNTLYENLTEKLFAAGFQLENRPYSPHITLAREVTTGMEPKRIKPFGEAVRCINLMQSARINGKLMYTAVYIKSMGGGL